MKKMTFNWNVSFHNEILNTLFIQEENYEIWIFFVIEMFWNVLNKERIHFLLQTEYFLFSAAITLSFIVSSTNWMNSFPILCWYLSTLMFLLTRRCFHAILFWNWHYISCLSCMLFRGYRCIPFPRIIVGRGILDIWIFC